MALALAVHILTVLTLWVVSPLRPILQNFDNAIDVTIETPAKEQLPAEAKKEEPPPPVELGLAPRQGLPEAPQIQPPPQQAEPELQPVPEAATPLPIPAPRPAPVPQLQASALPAPEPQPQAPAPPEPAQAPEPPTPPLEQIVPLPEAARPPTTMDFPKPAPPRPQAQPLPAPRPAPAPQPRLPTDNQAALKPSPLHSSTDVTVGNAADYYTQMTRRLGQYRYYPKSALDAQQEGRVVVRILIGRDGRLIDAQVEQSSGWPAIDAAEVDTVRRAAPFPPFPLGMAGETATFRSSVTYNPTVPRRLR